MSLSFDNLVSSVLGRVKRELLDPYQQRMKGIVDTVEPGGTRAVVRRYTEAPGVQRKPFDVLQHVRPIAVGDVVWCSVDRGGGVIWGKM